MGVSRAEWLGAVSDDGGGDPPPAEWTVSIPVTGELDLHPFAPRDIPSVVEEYVLACSEKGVCHLRLAHGRGRGVQRAVVRRVLASLAVVESFADAPAAAGGWGATVVELRVDPRREQR